MLIGLNKAQFPKRNWKTVSLINISLQVHFLNLEIFNFRSQRLVAAKLLSDKRKL
jgi:hypothetical protein